MKLVNELLTTARVAKKQSIDDFFLVKPEEIILLCEALIEIRESMEGVRQEAAMWSIRQEAAMWSISMCKWKAEEALRQIDKKLNK